MELLREKINFLMVGVKELSRGNFSYSIPVFNRDEFGFLTESFNHMSNLIKKRNEKIKENEENLIKKNIELQDLTVKLEEKVQERTKELENIIQTIGEGLFTVNLEQKIVYFNHEAENITGYKREEAIGSTCVDILKCPECKINCEFILTGKTENNACRIVRETNIINKNNEKIPIIKDAIIFKDKNNKITGAIETFRDITKIKEIQQMKNDFISMITHDLKSPLTSILGFATLYINDKKITSDENLKNAFRRIQSNGYKMLNLIENYLLINRMETDNFELNLKNMNIKKILFDVIKDIQSQASNNHIQIKTSFEENIPEILADKTHIERIFYNILSNAIKYSKPISGQSIYIEIKKNIDFINVIVADEGIGIPEEEMKNLFIKYKRFQNVKKIKGTGLGLYIAKKMIEAHKGKINIESEYGKYTKVTISLPYYHCNEPYFTTETRRH
ncbi:PAS domain S-box protein [Candidatus Desantisbacteria bacterium]|nr:PAS domain S-box protein [Candidatus Desantisbacteria bacterium]